MVIGCASFDTVHIESSGQRSTFNTTGGAGLYTALAARSAGAAVTLLAPRPEPMPPEFEEIAQQIRWIGPTVSADEMPRLEIVHHGNGSATLLSASWGKEELLSLADLPNPDNFDVIHVAALSTAARQLDFVKAVKGRKCLVSAGTYARICRSDGEVVGQIISCVDFFWMNANEARILFPTDADGIFPTSNQIVVVTDGGNGASIMTANSRESLPTNEVAEVDPTGAGDTLCGVSLACCTSGMTIKQAVQNSMVLAAKVVAAPGTEALTSQLRATYQAGETPTAST